MSREIKFRMWNRIVERMSNGYTLYELHAQAVNFPILEIMQYTGLKDKNGTELYEGDIVNQFTLEVKRTVVYHNGSFGYWDSEDVKYRSLISYAGNQWFDWKDSKSQHIEVIGNIYQNTELITA